MPTLFDLGMFALALAVLLGSLWVFVWMLDMPERRWEVQQRAARAAWEEARKAAIEPLDAQIAREAGCRAYRSGADAPPPPTNPYALLCPKAYEVGWQAERDRWLRHLAEVGSAFPMAIALESDAHAVLGTR